MTETTTTLQRLEDKPVAIKPVKWESLSERVNRVFDSVAKRAYELFDGNGRTFGHDLDDWFKAEMELLHPVHVHVAESAENLEVKAEVPGFNEKEIEVSVEPQRLTITGKRESNNEE
jgi:HSP20 family protein